MNILRTLNAIVKNEKIDKQTEKELAEAKEISKRSGKLAVGNIQLRTIKADGNIPTDVLTPIAENRPKNLIEELGINYLKECTAFFNYPIMSGSTSKWVDEGETSNFDDVLFDSVKLEPKRLLSYVEYSKDITLNPQTQIAKAIENDLVNSIYDKVQETMLNDIFDTANTISISGYSDIVDLEFSAGTKSIKNGVYIVSPLAAKKLKQIKNGDTPIYQNGTINGTKVYETASLSDERIIYGDFSKLLLAQWGVIDITVDDKTAIYMGIIKLTINSYWNWAVTDSNAFLFANT